MNWLQRYFENPTVSNLEEQNEILYKKISDLKERVVQLEKKLNEKMEMLSAIEDIVL